MSAYAQSVPRPQQFNAVHIVSVCVGDLRLNYLKKQYTVSATTHQMALLLAFNTAEQHSFRYIHTYIHTMYTLILAQCGSILHSSALLIDSK